MFFVAGPYRMSIWKHIRGGWNAFSSFVSINVGNGAKTRFWLDVWCSNCSLKKTFLELFCITRDIDAVVADHMVDDNDGLHRDMNYFKLVHDWELDSITLFFNTLYSVRVGRGEEDKFSWNLSKRQSFEVKTFYKVLSNVDSPSPWESIWTPKTPLRVAFFTWTTSLGKTITMDNLLKCHMIVMD